MHRWTILVSTLIIGTAIAVGVWFFVRMSTENNAIEDSFGEDQRGFFSFFGNQFGFNETPDQTTPTTTPDGRPMGPTFREILKRDKMLPLGEGMLAGATIFTTISTTTVVVPVLATSTPDQPVVMSTTTATTTETVVRFVQKETGHISDLSLETGTTLRLTNTTIPRIHEALFGNNGRLVVFRYLEDDNETITTFVSELPQHATTTPDEIQGTFFPQNIPSIAPNMGSNQLFYITTTAERSVARITDPKNISPQDVFSSPLREWLVGWLTASQPMVSSKPTLLASGIVQSILSNGSTQRLASGTGITALVSPSGTKILSAIANGGLQSSVLELASQDAVQFDIQVMPEKCAWKNDIEIICAVPNTIPQDIPDSWYQGSVSFTDNLWIINTETEDYTFLYAPEDTAARETMDITNLSISSDGDVLSFINKKDLRGWIADVSSEE